MSSEHKRQVFLSELAAESHAKQQWPLGTGEKRPLDASMLSMFMREARPQPHGVPGAWLDAHTITHMLGITYNKLLDLVRSDHLPAPMLKTDGKLAWSYIEMRDLIYLAHNLGKAYNSDRYKGSIPENNVLVIDVDTDQLYEDFNNNSKSKNLEDLAFLLSKIEGSSLDSLKRLVELKLKRSGHLPLAMPDVPQKWESRPAEFRRGKEYQSPSSFIMQHYGEFYSTGRLEEEHIEKIDPDLISAYRQRLYSHPHERLPLLAAPVSDAETFFEAVAELFGEDDVIRWVQARQKQRDRTRKRTATQP